MKAVVIKRSDVTTNNNIILTIEVQKVTPFGMKSAKYCMAVKAESAVDLEFECDIDLNDYTIVEREFVNSDGEVVHCKWLQ